MLNTSPLAKSKDTRSRWMRAQLFLRVVTLATSVVIFFGVPTLTQVESVRHRGLWGWYLYRSHGVGVMDLRFYVDNGDTSRVLDRARALGAANVYGLRRRTRAPRLKNLVAQTDRICRFVSKTHGPTATLRLDARVSGWAGWVLVTEELPDVCGEGRPALVRRVTGAKRKLRSSKRRIKLERWLDGESAP